MSLPHRQSIPTRFPQEDNPGGIYVHVPFCRTRCSYCGFTSGIYDPDAKVRYIRSILREIELYAHLAKRTAREFFFNTVYFGGGTPSLLDPEDVSRILVQIRSHLNVVPEEITLEMNPGTVDRARLSSLRRIGINRVSLGIQSLLDSELLLMGRSHAVADAYAAFRDLRAAGFDNVSLDLIAGFPSQTLESLKRSLDSILDLRPEHVSVYLLEVKPGTRLHRLIDAGELPGPDEDLAADMYETLCRDAKEAGYEHYEISNFALPGKQSIHNLKYWTDCVYIGFGPGAHSMDGRTRYANFRDLTDFEKAVEAGDLPIEIKTKLTPEMRFKDALIMGLRLVGGLNLELISERYNVDALQFIKKTVGDLLDQGLLRMQGEILLLTDRGRLLSNMVFSRWV
ncbi:radical SAM family heme chaperone HemW [Desulfomonile tiedjei]|uniref:Heme chaperone HemW n=1 Tax=Desulfomonile tiedjei (strain ATCC 49306 / DSM 6799 / DCB-1) TaxID=706587 RepID=I4C834_DESTA|nr:radical SAM family heme chaperone HemW [Desulfomonile tiedjei]AFM25725.1 putative oxygen-independent coproporphyrinogen III oxidase [Desulfomonile tiedjei DSM 6799]